MTKQWHVMRSARTLLEASSVANDALIALGFLEAAKARDRSLSNEAQKRYVKNLKGGLNLLQSVYQAIKSQTKGNSQSDESEILLRLISNGVLTTRKEELSKSLSEAITDVEMILGGRYARTTKAREIFQMISTASSGEISQIALRAK